MVVADNDFAELVIAVVLPVNAAMVVTLQYSIGRRLSAENIRPLMTLGTVCFVIGLVGFMFSGNNLLFWEYLRRCLPLVKLFTPPVNIC